MRFHRFVVMGVCGCGKTTVGQALAQALDCQFVEGDSLHPAANIDAMSRGVPLTDDMRRPWLTRIADELSTAQTGLVVSCSALKIAYRDILRGAGPVFFVHLTLNFDTAVARVGQRPDHYMPASLVKSQFYTLQNLGGAEDGISIDATLPPDQIVDQVLRTVS